MPLQRSGLCRGCPLRLLRALCLPSLVKDHCATFTLSLHVQPSSKLKVPTEMPGPPAGWFLRQPCRACWDCPPIPLPEPVLLRLSQQVPEWAGAHLEPADAEGSCNPGWPRGPVCDLAADTAPRAPAAQVGLNGSEYSPKGVKLWPSVGAMNLPWRLSVSPPAARAAPPHGRAV